MQFRGGMNELMKQASRMQRRIEQRREELKTENFEATSGNDRVKVVVTGGLDLVSVVIDPKLLEDEGLEMVQDLVVAAANSALKNARDGVDKELEKVTGGLKIPGLT
jgi:DNA-binding YbaB/EbfC family protein